MIAKERQQQILDLLNEHRIVTVQGLADFFSVAVITVRRDLDALAREGLIKKIYGGATLPDEKKSSLENVQYASRAVDYLDEKQAIAAAAIDLISKGETIFLDTGTTVNELAKRIQSRSDLTVVTNSLAVVNELMDSSVQLFCIGGWIGREQLSFTSDVTLSCLNAFCFDHCFCGAGGVSVQKGITDYRHETIQQRKTILERSASSILLAESNKFGKTAPFVVAPFSAFDLVITDASLSEDHKRAMSAAGISYLAVEV